MEVKKFVFKSWRTSAAGLLTLLLALAPTIFPDKAALLCKLSSVASASGLIVAADQSAKKRRKKRKQSEPCKQEKS